MVSSFPSTIEKTSQRISNSGLWLNVIEARIFYSEITVSQSSGVTLDGLSQHSHGSLIYLCVRIDETMMVVNHNETRVGKIAPMYRLWLSLRPNWERFFFYGTVKYMSNLYNMAF